MSLFMFALYCFKRRATENFFFSHVSILGGWGRARGGVYGSVLIQN